MNKISRLEHKLTSKEEVTLVTLLSHSTKADVYLLLIAMSQTTSKCLK